MSNIASDIALYRALRLVPRLITAADLDGDGLLTISLTSPEASREAAPLLLLDDGLVLAGIKIVAGDPDVDLTPILGGQLLTMYCPVVPGSALLEHEAGALVGAAEAYRFNVYPTAADLTVYRSLTQFVYDQTASRWWPTDWGAYTGSNASFASPNATMTQAIERIAADLAILKGAPIT